MAGSLNFIYDPPQLPSTVTAAGGIADNAALWDAARDSARFADNFNASQQAMDVAFDRRDAAVFKATGVHLISPIESFQNAGGASVVAVPRQNWKALIAKQLAELADAHPDKLDVIRPNISLEKDAAGIALEAGNRFDAQFASRDDFWSKWTITLGGALAGGMRDPLQVATLFAGGGVGGARTIAGRILSTAAREAVVNGAIEGMQQPVVQAWREQAGLPHGFAEALRNTASAAVFAGVAGGGFKALGEAAHALMKGTVPDAPLTKAMDGDVNAARDILPPVADALPPEARGALQAAEADAATQAARPTGLDPETHDANVAAAMRSAEDGTPPVFVKPRQQAALKRPMTVTEFIASMGGLRDDGGELAARGVTIRNSMTRFGPWYRPKGTLEAAGTDIFGNASGGRRGGKGAPPDRVREALVEAGYLQDKGSQGGLATTTESDVYELIDRQMAGEAVISERDRHWQMQLDEEKALKYDGAQLKERYGKDARLVENYGYGIADEAIAMRQAGLDWLPDDLEAAADWHAQFPHETPRVAIEEAIGARLFKQEQEALALAREINANDFLPGWEPLHGERLDQGSGSLGSDGRADAEPGSQGAADGQRGDGAQAGSGTADETGLNTSAPLTEGGLDDPNAPAVGQLADDALAAIKADEAMMAQEIWAEFPDGSRSPGYHKISDLIENAERPEHLSALVEACKAV